MRARHLGVPGQRQLATRQAADRDPIALGAQRHEQLRFVAVAVLEERLPGARGVDHRLELGRGAAVESQGIRHEATLGHRVTSTDR